MISKRLANSDRQEILDVRRERFLNNIEARVERALDRIRLVGQCFTPNNYDWTEDEGEKVVAALTKAVIRVRGKARREVKTKNSFKL